MSTFKCVAATVATLTLSSILFPMPTHANPRQSTKTSVPVKVSSQDPLQYVHRGTSAKGEFIRTLSLFKNNRVLLVSREADQELPTVQTGTWKRGSRADRLSISLTQQNGKPYKETILLTGTPGNGGVLSSIGESATQYGAYGLTFAPRIPNKVAISFDNKKNRTTITATGIKPTPFEQVANAQITSDGYDVIYWQTVKGNDTEPERQALYYFNTLTGQSRQVATFPQPIGKINEGRLASGRPVLIVSLPSVAGVALVDPLRERTVKEWSNARLTGVRPGKITIATYRPEEISRENAKPISTQTASLDRFF